MLSTFAAGRSASRPDDHGTASARCATPGCQTLRRAAARAAIALTNAASGRIGDGWRADRARCPARATEARACLTVYAGSAPSATQRRARSIRVRKSPAGGWRQAAESHDRVCSRRGAPGHGCPGLRPSAYCNRQHSQSTLRRPSTTLTVINALW